MRALIVHIAVLEQGSTPVGAQYANGQIDWPK